MGSFSRSDAYILAATEALPAQWHDLSEALERLHDRGATWPDELIGGAAADDFARYVAQMLSPSQIEKWEGHLRELSIVCPEAWLTSVIDPTYPQNLRAVYDRPPFLFVRGTLEAKDAKAIAIVGSRDASPDATEAASIVAKTVGGEGITVVSGLARGIDAAAHRGAIAGGGRTIAVLGTGIDKVYPPEHADLAQEITTHGALVSQFRPGSPGTKSSFPMRNTVVSGLSLVSVLIDGGERSGTKSEAEAALRHNRRVVLWKPNLSNRAWAQRWIEHDSVFWAESPDDVLCTLAAVQGE